MKVFFETICKIINKSITIRLQNNKITTTLDEGHVTYIEAMRIGMVVS